MSAPPSSTLIPPHTHYDALEAMYYAINWRQDAKLLVSFTILPVTLLIVLISGRRDTKQVVTFAVGGLSLALTMLAQPLNSYMRLNWQKYASQNYFDRRGAFMGIFWCGPLILVSLVAAIILLQNVGRMFRRVGEAKAQRARRRKQMKTEHTNAPSVS